MTEDPYSILDVDKSASDQTIKESYREKVKENHPDVGGDKDEFIRIKEAYEDIISEDDENIVDKILNNKADKSKNDSEKNIYPVTVYYINYDLIKIKEWTINENIFERVSMDDYNDIDIGKFTVNRDETILEAAENSGMAWPYSCRGGACSNCAIKVLKGDVKTPKHHILSEELLKDNYRLSCIGKPKTSKIYLIYNIKNHQDIQDLLLPSKKD